MRRVLWVALVAARAWSSPQTPDAMPTIRSETRVVQIQVSARDAHGKPVRDLKQADFTVTDGGKPRAISIFQTDETAATASAGAPSPPVPRMPPGVFSNRIPPAGRPPRPTAILFDGINSQFETQAYMRLQVIKLLPSIPLQDPIALYAMTPDLVLLQSFTTDRDLLLKSIRGFFPKPPHYGAERVPFVYSAEQRNPPSLSTAAGSDLVLSPGMGEQQRFQLVRRVDDTLHMLQALARLIGPSPGRKAIIWLTAGFPPSQLRDQSILLESTLAVLNEANIALHVIDARGLLTDPRAIINVTMMQEMADRTGGVAYYNRNDIGEAVAQAVRESEFFYTLGFYLGDQDLDGKYHELQVRAARTGLVLRHRLGYIASATGQPAAPAKKPVPLDETVFGPVDLSSVAMDVRAKISQGQAGKTLDLRLGFEPQTLTLREVNGIEHGRIEELYVQMDAAGKVLSKHHGEITFQSDPRKRAEAHQLAVGHSKSLPVTAGATEIVIVIRDVESGRVGSLRIPLAGVSSR